MSTAEKACFWSQSRGLAFSADQVVRWGFRKPIEPVQEFKRLYDEQCLIKRHGFRTPSQGRAAFAATSRGLDAGYTCCNLS